MRTKNKKILFIGDTEGRLDNVQDFYKEYPNYLKVLVGDIQDRGHQSKELLDFLMEQKKTICLFGNHEQMFLDFMKKDSFSEEWILFLINGGLNTIISYANEEDKKELEENSFFILEWLRTFWDSYGFRYIHKYSFQDFLDGEYKEKLSYNNQYLKYEELILKVKKEIDKKYVDFIESFPKYLIGNNFFCSHAPMNFIINNLNEFDESLIDKSFLWNRFIYNKEANFHQIYGHNSRKKEIIKNNCKIICVDNSSQRELLAYNLYKDEFISKPF